MKKPMDCCIPAHLKAVGMNIRVRYAPSLTVEQSSVLLLTHKTHRFRFPMVSSPGLQILVLYCWPPMRAARTVTTQSRENKPGFDSSLTSSLLPASSALPSSQSTSAFGQRGCVCNFTIVPSLRCT